MAYVNGNINVGFFHGNRIYLDGLAAGGIEPPICGYRCPQGTYNSIEHDPSWYYAIDSESPNIYLHAVLELTAEQYEGMSSHGSDTLYIITSASTISDVYVGDTECEKLYLGSTELWVKQAALPILPRRMKLAYDIAKRYWDRNYSPFKTKAIVLRDAGIDAISSTHSVYVWVSTEDTKEITYTDQSSSERTANIGGIQALYRKDDGWTTPTMYSIQNMSIGFPTYQYNNNMLVPASGFTLTYQGNTLSQEYDFDTLEPVPLPSYFPNVNLDDIVTACYTPPYNYFIDIMGEIDDNTVGFVRAYYDGEDEASLGGSMTSTSASYTYSQFWTTYYHTSSTKHTEYIFKLDKSSGTVTYHNSISAGTGRHPLQDYILFKNNINDNKWVEVYTNNSCYPELGSSIKNYLIIR